MVGDLRCNVSTVSLYIFFAHLVPNVDVIYIFCFLLKEHKARFLPMEMPFVLRGGSPN